MRKTILLLVFTTILGNLFNSLYAQNKERREQLIKQGKSPLKFKRNKIKHPAQKGRKYRILVLIIILSLLAYKLLIN